MSLEAHYSPVAQAMEQNPLRPSWTMQRPGLISLAYGFPDSQSFPYEELAEATAGLMAAHNAEALQYGPVSGPEPLRRFLADWACTTEGLDVGPDNIMITSGASQGIALAARLLVPPGGTVIVESPTFIGALWFFRGLGINTVGVDTDALGIVPSSLRETVTQPASIRRARSPSSTPCPPSTTPSASTPRWNAVASLPRSARNWTWFSWRTTPTAT